MTFLRSIFKVAHNISYSKRCFILSKNNWNAERYFGNKIEVPSPPKRPLTAYMLYCKEKRKELLKENPSLKITDQIKILAKKWNHLTEDMKEPYQKSAREIKQLFGMEHKAYYESLTEKQKEEILKLKAKKKESRRISKFKKLLRESGLPKGPNSAYTIFVQAESKKNPVGAHPSEFIKKVASLWNSLPEDSKKIYEKQAEEEKMLYAEQMKEWRTKMLLDGNKKVLKAYEELKGKGKNLDAEEGVGSKKETTDAELPSTKN